MKLHCADCGLLYGGTKWADVVIPDEIWSQIDPSKDGRSPSILCFNCMVGRLARLDFKEVPIYIGSGPFAKAGDIPSWKKQGAQE